MSAELNRIRGYIVEERHAAEVYRRLAEVADGNNKEELLRLAEGEVRHAEYWENVLERLGGANKNTETVRLSVSAWITVSLAKRFGLIAAMPLLERHEGEEILAYSDDPLAEEYLVDEEREHTEAVQRLAPEWREKIAMPFRAGIFGFSDGVVSNLALVIGVFGAGQSRASIIATGIAGLVAGAMSMGVGEYVSVASQAEILGAHEESDGSRSEGMQAAVSSVVTFASGALLPLLGFFFTEGVTAVVIALIITGTALFTVGGSLTFLTFKPFWRSGGRQLLLGWLAAAATYGIGLLIGG